MSKTFKFFIIFICLIIMVSCQKEITGNEDKIDSIEYPSYTIEEYNKMDSYTFEEVIDNVKYKYTYFFSEELCVNLKEELTFKDKASAKEFYDEIDGMEDYISVTMNNNVVTYYYNPEYLIYLMYPKDALITILTKSDAIEE